ncbi:uncharacterized protein LOC132756177 [Ruditapes philippinarum]|uniref:uncharacterized protein LOC132756177 n=1 Tax=Ruditapes philippinarum TaxID=129788 RepID=UPI00295B3208|nr:uncharacterized protein LOC132756177 [Ruditapes philippinarum]
MKSEDTDTVKSAKADVFIVHSAEDSSQAAIINKTLEEFGLSSFDYKSERHAFTIGKPVFDNIVYAIKHAEIVLILVTEHSMKSHWVSLETQVALENSQRGNILSVRLVFAGVSEKDRLEFKHGMLATIPDIVVDFNKEHWKESFIKMIKENIPTQKLLPAGNVAHGLVFNYFSGYLTYVLPAISKSVEQVDIFTSDKFSKKMFIVIPESCDVTPLEGSYENFVIEKMDKTLDIDATHGDKRRKYTLTIYKITKGSEFYYFCADCPFIIATMLKMKTMGFANIDLHYQVIRFYMTLKELVEHRSNLECKDTANIIMFNKQKFSSSPAQDIWTALEAELNNLTDIEPKAIQKRNGVFENCDKTCKVTVTYSADKNTNQPLVDEITDFLTKHNVNFTCDESDETDLEATDTNWRIFVLTDTSIKDGNMIHEFNEAMSISISKNKVQVIPIVAKGVNMKDIPYSLKWITILSEEDPCYLDTMWSTMQDERNLEELLPAGSLYEGLAYSYMLNYMSFNLVGKTDNGKDFKERFTDAVTKRELSCHIVPKVFVIVPESCEFPPPGTQFEHEEHIGPLEPIVIGSRKYFLQLYVLTLSKPGKWKGQRVCYAREYATPVIALNDMTRLPFAGLSVSEMKKQAKQFAEFSNEIMKHEKFNKEIGDVKDKCSIVYFEDDTHGMAGVTRLLEEQIIQCLEEDNYIKPS